MVREEGVIFQGARRKYRLYAFINLRNPVILLVIRPAAESLWRLLCKICV